MAKAAQAAEVRAEGHPGDQHRRPRPGGAGSGGAAKVSPTQQASQDRAEPLEAARWVAKVWVLRHEVLGVPYPAGSLARHPEVAALTGSATRPGTAARSASTTKSPTATKSPSKSTSASPTKAASSSRSANGSASATRTPSSDAHGLPVRDEVLDPTQVHAQVRSYWCGPTSTQMIVWG